MKNFYFVAIFIAFCLSISISKSQDLDWPITQPDPTGAGNATIALMAESVTLNGETVSSVGALVGTFYINDSGGYSCGGWVELDENYMTGGNIAIAAWGADAGEDNVAYHHVDGGFYYVRRDVPESVPDLQPV